MNLRHHTILITGATGGIGEALARQLADRGARLQLSGRASPQLDSLVAELVERGAEAIALPADLADPEGAQRLANHCLPEGLPDVIIHCAGMMHFGDYADVRGGTVDALMQVNALSPMQLTRALLPALQRRGSGRLVFVGSVFGSLAFPLYATYSASKFALRGFAQALRRELDGSGVDVTYVAPRFTDTRLNQGAPAQIAEHTKMARDTPEQVAAAIVVAIEQGRRYRWFGWAERLFMTVNSLWPSLIDKALRKQTRQMRAIAGIPPTAPSLSSRGT
ncbi:SDR family oxidoreductase [Flagellatimonas centrodinii]|uniref:SDR family oxidoreductase n=1 Tax=Flagellatimonas centrodinii TaxID=2806210 RepID=UPI001FED7949|nr:SDR family oxidoreductase [Flagellatimonas centrodinii]ULQ47249.1 SDR family oxidoreductase [Flagellatimonas centrodinii]